MTEFKIARMPIGQAWTWFKNAFRLLKAQPLTICVTTAWLLLTLMLLAQAPIVGPMLAALIFPALSFGMADVNQKIRLQMPASPLDVFSGFHPNHRLQLLTIGAFLSILLFASFTLMRQFDLAALTTFSQNLINQAENLDTSTLTSQLETALKDPAFARAASIVNLFTLLNMFIIGLLAFAPLFVAWQHTQPVQAIGLSLLAIGRNLLPLSLLLLMVFIGFFILSNLLVLLIALLPFLGVWIILPVIFLSTGFLFTLVFTSYHNIITTSLNNAKTA